MFHLNCWSAATAQFPHFWLTSFFIMQHISSTALHIVKYWHFLLRVSFSCERRMRMHIFIVIEFLVLCLCVCVACVRALTCHAIRVCAHCNAWGVESLILSTRTIVGATFVFTIFIIFLWKHAAILCCFYDSKFIMARSSKMNFQKKITCRKTWLASFLSNATITLLFFSTPLWLFFISLIALCWKWQHKSFTFCALSILMCFSLDGKFLFIYFFTTTANFL